MSILVVEDEWLIAMQIARDVRDLDCRVIGPAPSVAVAEVLLETETPDAALIDIRLGHDLAYSFADRLRHGNVPFAFVTAYTRVDLPARFQDCPLLMKPFREGDLKAEIAALLRP